MSRKSKNEKRKKRCEKQMEKYLKKWTGREKLLSPRIIFSLFFVVTVFCILVATMTSITFAGYLLIRHGILNVENSGKPIFSMLTFSFVIASIIVGTIFSFVFGHIPLKPLYTLIEGMNRLAAGDYKTRIIMGPYRAGKDLEESFNTLATELQNTEMLRSDFVNNFSHEFKTPIVSISGFAQLLNRGNLTEEQKAEYLKIIEEESQRLATMATNVLNLTKLENQNILTDITEFNLSEQIRTCVLLLEKKWTQKELELSIEFNEFMIRANEEMLKQVWINLLDNAVKFTPQGGEICIKIKKEAEKLVITIQNTDSHISEEDQKYIFNKFYQADTSHSGEGTGTGLAIVKKIVELHKGVVSVESTKRMTAFHVELPQGE